MSKTKIVVTDNREIYKKKKKCIRGFANFIIFLMEEGKDGTEWVNFSINYFLNKHKEKE